MLENGLSTRSSASRCLPCDCAVHSDQTSLTCLVLVQRVARGGRARVRRLVDEHGVAGADVGAGEAGHEVQQRGVEDVPGQHRVPAEVLDLVVDPLIRQPRAVLQGEVLHPQYLSRVHNPIDNVQEPLTTFIDEFVRNQLRNNKKPILFIELSLRPCQDAIIRNCEPKTFPVVTNECFVRRLDLRHYLLS